MKNQILGIGVAALVASVAFATEPTDATKVASMDTSPAAFSKLDADKDGRVSAIEAANDSKLAGAFTQADTDKDGYLSSSEFQALGMGSVQPQSEPSSTMTPEDATTPPSDTAPQQQ